MIELVDTHCHLDMPAFEKDIQQVIKRAEDSGIRRIITIGTDLKSSQAALELAHRFESVYASVGVHPHEASGFQDSHMEHYRNLLKDSRVVAVGEIGLDYYYEHSPKAVQKEVFARFLSLAKEVQKPVIIHSRQAPEDTIRILKESGITKGVMHCFSADEHTMQQAMAMGLYISFAGPVTFKNARRLPELVRLVPDEYLLIETDAPYLTPVPYRGRRNEPAFLVHTARKIASIRGISLEDVARITTLNARRLFNIDEIPQEGTIAYKIRNSLYLNITNRCTNACSFCVRFHTDYVKGHNLRLSTEPELQQLKDAIGRPDTYKEVVFCGYGEPLIRLDLVKALAKWIKQNGGRVRINTNGHGNAIHGRNILPELAPYVDSISISLDAQDEETYERICKPLIKDAFREVLEFIREARKYIPEVTVTVVETEGVDVEKCRQLASELGVNFRLRKLNVVG